jgi:peptidoglycan LD-endopeptidase LytH
VRPVRRSTIALLTALATAALGLLILTTTNAFDRPRVLRSSPSPAPDIASGPHTPPSPASSASLTARPASPSTIRTTRRTSEYVFPVAGCRATYSRGHHHYPAADIFADVGCRFVSPTDGHVDEVTRIDQWNPRSNNGPQRGGISISVIGVDGVRYYGAHLTWINPMIRPGTKVRAGQELGRVGRTGSARNTPPHLHFGISWPTGRGHWWIRRGLIAPQPFLDDWRASLNTSPAAAVRRVKARHGPTAACRSYC